MRLASLPLPWKTAPTLALVPPPLPQTDVALLLASARLENGRVHLGAWRLLNVVRDASYEELKLVVGAMEYRYERKRLSRCRGPLKAFADLQAFVDDAGLCFRWRGGRGALRPRPTLECARNYTLKHPPLVISLCPAVKAC